VSARKFQDRVFIVTGSTQGIGEAIALRLAEGGAKGVVITGRNTERGAKVVAAVEKLGASALFVPGELSKEADCRAIVQAADKRFGRIDGLVSAAGLAARGTVENTSVELWDYLFALNVRAPFILSQEVVKLMRRDQRRGVIVNVISMSSHGGQPFLVAYSTSKGALATLTKNLAYALRKDRIRVNGINLGWTSTPGEDAIQKATGAPADWLEKAVKNQIFGRLVLPKDVANLVEYLASDDSEMMTGSLIDLDQNVVGTYD
jgi:NAD(P)-dependent dehydrogenase (short-subunit alcohol dehydrogenase family)